LLTAEPATPSVKTAARVWNVIELFEGRAKYQSVSNGFDCQGMSIGSAQWNVGKSFNAVKSILLSNSNSAFAEHMPTFGKGLLAAVSESQGATMKFVESLQVNESQSCDSKTRKTKWTAQGNRFVRELSSILGTDASIGMQRKLANKIFMYGLKNAQLWATTTRGLNAVPSTKEIAYFVDMQTFNGGGFAKFGVCPKVLSPAELEQTIASALKLLKTADEPYLLHKVAARKNGKLLNLDTQSENDRALFACAYLLTQKLNAPHARQFKLTTLNRRAIILFGEAYYADSDKQPRKANLNDAEN
jgi:hypothetical protein